MIINTPKGIIHYNTAVCAHGTTLLEDCVVCADILAKIRLDDLVARRQESNPEWFRGSPRSAFFTTRSEQW
jgi:hypothetical protein